MEIMPNISMALLAIQHNNGDQQHMIIDVAPDGSIKVRKPFTIRLASGLGVDVIITLTFHSSCGQAFVSFADDALDATKVLPAGRECDFSVTPHYFRPKSSSIPKEERNRCTMEVFINNVHVGSVPIKVFQKSTSFGNSLNVFYSFQLCPESVFPSQLLFTFTNERKQVGNPSSPSRQRANSKVANSPRNDRRSSLDSLPPLLPVAQRSTEAAVSTSPLPPSLASVASPCSLFTPSAFFQTSSSISSSTSSSSSSSSSSPPPFPLQSSEDSQCLTGLDGNPWHSDEEMAFESLFSLSHEVLE